MEHLVCFYPFFKAYALKRDYDAPSLALGVLTFLIEKGRLQGRTVRPDEIRGYIEGMMKEMYPGQAFDYQEVTRTVLGDLETTPSGELYRFQYLDPVRKQQVDRYVHLVEYDVSEGAYQITDAGLEFMITIKELPEESRVTVALILFKKQIESGSFWNALETVRSLNLEVHRKKGKRQALIDSMIYGDPDVVEKFTAYTRDVISQLEQEEELFRQVQNTLQEIAGDTKRITDNSRSLGDEEDFITIKELADELDYGYRLHNNLLENYTTIPAEYERIVKIRLTSLFDRRYQFQKTLENHIQANLPNDVYVVEMLPFLLPDPRKTFSLCKLFEPQNVIGKKAEVAETRVKEEWGDAKSPDDIVHERQVTTFTAYASVLLDAFRDGGSLDLPGFLDLVLARYGDGGMDHIDLIPFLIEMNKGVRQDEKEAYETVFDLHTPEEWQGVIEKILVSVATEKEVGIDTIRVRSRPEIRVPLTDERDVYVSYLDFMGEKQNEI